VAVLAVLAAEVAVMAVAETEGPCPLCLLYISASCLEDDMIATGLFFGFSV